VVGVLPGGDSKGAEDEGHACACVMLVLVLCLYACCYNIVVTLL
jgi:hypothetical protein